MDYSFWTSQIVAGFDSFYFYSNSDTETCDENDLVVISDLELRTYTEENTETGASPTYGENPHGTVNGGKDECLSCNILFTVPLFCSMTTIFI